MRKILFSIIIVLLAIGSYFFLVNGISIGSFKLNGVKEIKQLGATLDNKIYEATELTTVTYNNTNKTLNDRLNDLQSKRKEYENKVAISSPEEITKASTKERHQIQFLWAKIGNYATKNGLKLTLDVRTSAAGVQGEKDLEFTLEGSYDGIANFLYNIEEDESLNFRIENFKLLPITVAVNNGEQATTISTLQAKFSVKEINVDLG